MRPWTPMLGMLMAGCAAAPHATLETQPPLLEEFEGSYSNYSQVAADEGAGNVLEQEVQRLGGDGFSAFLVTRRFRDGGNSQSRLYRFDAGPDTATVELRIRILTPEQAAAGPDTWLALAAAEFDEGCVIELSREQGALRGHTQIQTCRYRHPIAGEVGVFRQITLSPGKLQLDEFLVDDDDNPVGGERNYVFDRHRNFRATGAFQLPEPDGAAGPWRESTVTAMRDDGRQVELFDVDGASLGFALQLARLKWQPGKPNFLRLAVYQVETGAQLAYYWAEPGAEQIEFDRDWLRIRVEDAARQSAE